MTFLQAGQNQEFFETQWTDYQGEAVDTSSVFIAESPVMKKIYNKIKELAFSSSPVLILGASGTGHNTVAEKIFSANENHNFSHFINFVCYGLSPNMIEKKLFPNDGKEGLLNCGQNRILFIKGLEIWPSYLQNKLLSFILESRSKATFPRLICSAREELARKTKEGAFSQDLFEVLSKQLLILPPLSERHEDIPFFISLFNKRNSFKAEMSYEALKILKSCPWNGNITELKNVCLQMSILYKERKAVSALDVSFLTQDQSLDITKLKYNPNLKLEELINRYIEMSVKHFQSKKKSAEALGISVKTIYNKIKTGCVCPD